MYSRENIRGPKTAKETVSPAPRHPPAQKRGKASSRGRVGDLLGGTRHQAPTLVTRVWGQTAAVSKPSHLSLFCRKAGAVMEPASTRLLNIRRFQGPTKPDVPCSSSRTKRFKKEAPNICGVLTEGLALCQPSSRVNFTTTLWSRPTLAKLHKGGNRPYSFRYSRAQSHTIAELSVGTQIQTHPPGSSAHTPRPGTPRPPEKVTPGPLDSRSRSEGNLR